MAAISPNTSSPLSQALTRKRANPFPLIILAVGLIIALTCAIFGFIESRRTETVIILARDLAYGQQITAEDLGTIELPLHRPTQLVGLNNPALAIGQYAARDLGVNDLLQTSMVMPEPPDQPVYPNGQELSADMVPMPFATTTIGPLSFRDRVNIGFNDPTGDPALCDQAQAAVAGQEPTQIAPRSSALVGRPYACRLLSSVRVLYVDETEGLAYLELTPYQSHTIWALQAAGLPLWGERYGATSQALETLERLDIGQINLSELDASAQPDAAAQPVPGAETNIPGSQP